MNDLDELKQYAIAQARSQAVDDAALRPLLDAIRTDEDGTAGSWVHEWTRAAQRLEEQGRLLEAVRFHTLARFPFPDGAARRRAQERAAAVFTCWAEQFPQLSRLDVPTPHGPVRVWATGLDPARPRPLLLISGGIISTKEQWAPVLLELAAFDLAGVVVELPGVGENPLRYDADSHRLLSWVLDAVGDRADTSRTYALALSFSGHLALRAALTDRRLRGVVGAGLPVRDFFTDRRWQAKVPRVTVDTLAHLLGTAPHEVFDTIRDWGLAEDELRSLDIEVAHVTSLRDEIIPPSDSELLRRALPSADIRVHDDVHGSPAHFPETRLFTLLSVLRMRGGAPETVAVLQERLTAAERAAAGAVGQLK
ncbi:hydrolase superfamily dihydrolipoamide acyltransferase-like protein [Streptomyces incarnatus]|uniref:Hydrolase superfamily dihydrolipoamide acyltransferase-like protein n=1 Tax=Streptomyces incarnatus TaxID=665007 RepID=A0ABN4G9C2_9ACTN|nr:alpha/beta hydrolase [Streptomyces incarnatus]AKJ08824.1 hydrolase superfamily dihydrolipoamide acyltransferase-like protein [Streptomyces incarnatus]